MVLRRSTTLWTWLSDFINAARSMVSFMVLWKVEWLVTNRLFGSFRPADRGSRRVRGGRPVAPKRTRESGPCVTVTHYSIGAR